MANDNHLLSVPCYNGTMLKHDYYNEFFELGQQKINFSFFDVNVNTQRSPNLSKNAFLHFAQMHPLVFVCFDTLLSLCSKKSH